MLLNTLFVLKRLYSKSIYIAQFNTSGIITAMYTVIKVLINAKYTHMNIHETIIFIHIHVYTQRHVYSYTYACLYTKTCIFIHIYTSIHKDMFIVVLPLKIKETRLPPHQEHIKGSTSSLARRSVHGTV